MRPLILAALALCFLPATASAWWNNSWGLRRKITFNNSGQPSPLSNFPVLIRLDSTRVEYFRTQNLGQDIRFVDADDTTQLNHEIELWNEAGSSYVWVRVPQVDGGSTTDYIWMYYDNPAAADGQNKNAVWDANFKMVQHLNQTAGTHFDSTSNTNNSVAIQVTPPQGLAVGQINGADLFSAAAGDNVEIADSATLNIAAAESFTVEAWIRPATLGNFQEIVSKDAISPPQGGWDFILWNNNTVRFNVYDNTSAIAVGQGGAVAANTWYYVVGTWDRPSRTAEIFLDAVSVGSGANAGLAGSAFSNTNRVGIGEEFISPGAFNFDGRIDEVRISKTPRSNDWIRAQNLSMRDTFASFAPAMAVGCCQALSTTEVAGPPQTVTVTAAGSFEMRFNTATGGGIDQFFDLAEDPGGLRDLAGAAAGGFQQVLLSDEVSNFHTGLTAGANNPAGRVDLLEYTPTRVRVRQESLYQRDFPPFILDGLKGFGDYSIYGSGRLALRWNKKATANVSSTFQQRQFTVHYQAGAPLNAWTGYGQTSGPIASPFPFPAATGPAADGFVLAQIEQAGAPGARTDFLSILDQNWGAANNTFFGSLGGVGTDEWEELGWGDSDTTTIFAGVGPYSQQPGETWNLLTYFKPTIFVNGVDPAVISRSVDYRTPDPLSVIPAGRWLLASENTGAGDDFNEAEAAYALTLDPALGLTFDIDGTVANPRYHPFFKVRHWRSLAGPASVTLEGTALTSGVDYRADVKPLSRAHFANTLSWHSTLEDANSLGVNLDVGSSGGQFGVTYVAGKYGNGVVIDANGDAVTAGTAGSLDFNVGSGAVEFWYQPDYPNTDGARHILWSTQAVGPDYFVLEKAAGNSLVFTITNSGTTTTMTVAAANYSWRAFDWVHLRTEWNSAALPGSQLRIVVNGAPPGQVSGGPAYNSSGMNKGPIAFGTCGGGACPFGVPANANGIIDEAHIYIGANSTPQLLAYGGLTANANEFLADPTPARNAPLMNLRVDGSRRGQYVYFGSDSQFRGLNVGLSALGGGVGDNDLVWQYWNGTAWTSLESVAGFTDTTLSFKKSGNVFWQDPPAWAPYSVNGGPDLYYVRVYLDFAAAGDYSPIPVEGLIKTDILLLQYCGDITAAAQTFSIPAPIPTAVSLQSFSATGRDSAVDLSWATASELSNLGFHLYRADSADGPYIRITSSLIPGLGSSPTGQSYGYRDTGLVNGRTYYYELEDVETTGKTQRHGPVSATPSPSAGSPPAPPPADTSATTYGDPSGVVLREIERDARHVVLELLTGGFTASPAEGGRVRLAIPGFESASGPGKPDLPMRRALVAAAAGRKVRLASVVASDVLHFAGLRPVAEATPGVEATGDGSVVTSSRTVSEGAAFSGLFPAASARLEGVVFQGETKKANLLLSPLRWDGNSLELSRRLLVRLDFVGREAAETGLGGSQGRRVVARGSHGRRGVVAQLVVRDRGLHRVDYGDVFSGRSEVLASNLRLSRQGTSVAFHVEPNPGRFGPGSSLYFLSEGSSLNPYGDAVYELETGPRGTLMPVERLIPDSTPVSEEIATLDREENRYYQAGLLDAPDLWLWDIVVSPASKSYPFTVDHVSSLSPGHVSVSMQGASDFEGVTDHHVRVRVNGVMVGEGIWDGRLPQTLDFEVGAGTLREGANSLDLENVGDTGAAYSFVFLNRFSLRYPRTLVATQGTLEGSFAASGQAAIDGLSSASLLLDTTESPRWLTGGSATASGLSFPVQAGRSYLATRTVLRPEVRRIQARSLKDATNRADYLLLAPKAFLTAAQPLLDWRESHGLVTKAVSLEDVYEQFGHGEVGPKAIKEFLEYAYQFWASPSPRYVLLLGDASYDPKDYLKTGVVNWLPGFPVKTSYLWTVSDPAYASVNGNDLVPDVAIGRLPASNAAEADRLVQKVLAFENGGGNFDGPAVLVADNADLAGNFEQDADEIAATILASRNPRKIYYSREGANTRAEIEDAFDQGASFLSYIGHGGTVVWASENIFNYQDVASLRPQSQQPLLLTMNCLNGFFHFPPLNSLSEELLKADGKGVIAAFSPSGLSVNDAAHLYHKAVLQEILSGKYERLGDAILAAQEDYAHTGAFPELLSIYHLFGDPAMRVH